MNWGRLILPVLDCSRLGIMHDSWCKLSCCEGGGLPELNESCMVVIHTYCTSRTEVAECKEVASSFLVTLLQIRHQTHSGVHV